MSVAKTPIFQMVSKLGNTFLIFSSSFMLPQIQPETMGHVRHSVGEIQKPKRNPTDQAGL
jgi:hypothetical protein